MAKKIQSAVVAAAVSPVVVDMTMTDCFGPLVESAEVIAARKQAEAVAELEAAFGPMCLTEVKTVPVAKGTGVCSLVKNMLVTSATYHEILVACYDKFPGCKTTAKSIASIARDMRKQGLAVAKR